MKLNELTLQEALEGLKSKKFTSKEITQNCLSRIKEVNSEINAYLLVLEQQALEQAEEADKIIQGRGADAFEEYPLLGVPYSCKDNFNTYGIQTTASSKILEGYIPPYESTVTKKLKNAGAVLLGKTNLDAFAHGSSTETSDFGTTLNPWDTSRVAGGSSGGAAASVASHTCIFAIGSETAGSIRGPAAWCGVTGLKPSYGRVSRYGVIAMASSTDSPGPIGKSVWDCTYILKVIAGKDPLDATSSPTEVALDITEPKDLEGIKIGLAKSYFVDDMDPEMKKSVETALGVFRQLGAEIIAVDLMDPKYSIAVYTILQRSEVSSNLGRFDGIRYGKDRSNFNFENKKRILLGTYTLSVGYYDQFYSKAQKVRTLIVEDFNKVFDEVDFIFGPVMPVPALLVGESDKSPMFGEMMDVLLEPSAIAGLCALSLPCGFVNKLPAGFQLIGKQMEEYKIINAGIKYQAVTNFHKEFPKEI
jgi:aspartyl-tRNA(Asn)/glutamyl-tRNA(Gln) amidotransferase subunit A